MLLLSACSIDKSQLGDSYIKDVEQDEVFSVSKLPYPEPNLVYSDDTFKMYSFNSGGSFIDLNFDGVDDYVFMSHITGADYYDYHTNANRDIYNFFINYNNSEELNSFNLVTKEVLDEKIINFDRDFVVADLMGCNSGGVLRVVKAQDETFLITAKENPGEVDGANVKVLFNVYILNRSGELRGSDYMFSLLNSVAGQSRGCGIQNLFDKDIISILNEFFKI